MSTLRQQMGNDDLEDGMGGLRVNLSKQHINAIQRVSNNPAIVVNDNGTLSLGKLVMTGYGLDVPEGVTLDDFKIALNVFIQIREQINLWFGDLLVAMDNLSPEDREALAKDFGYAITSAHNLKSVASLVPIYRRREIYRELEGQDLARDRLLMGHLDPISRIKDEHQQREMMRRVLVEGLNVRQTREEVKKLLKQGDGGQRVWNLIVGDVNRRRRAAEKWDADVRLRAAELYERLAEDLRNMDE